MAGKNKPPPPDESNKGKGQSGDKKPGESDKDFYERQEHEQTGSGNGGNKT